MIYAKSMNMTHSTTVTSWALSIRPKIPVCSFGNFQWRMTQHFPEFLGKRTTLRGLPETSYRELPFRLTISTEVPELSAEWFTLQKFDNFRIFWKLSQDIPLPLVPVSKISEFKVEWKAPVVTDGEGSRMRCHMLSWIMWRERKLCCSRLMLSEIEHNFRKKERGHFPLWLIAPVSYWW